MNDFFRKYQNCGPVAQKYLGLLVSVINSTGARIFMSNVFWQLTSVFQRVLKCNRLFLEDGTRLEMTPRCGVLVSVFDVLLLQSLKELVTSRNSANLKNLPI